jgi:hypothetical protein
MRFRGRNGETGLNPFRCLAKLDAGGYVRLDGRVGMWTRTHYEIIAGFHTRSITQCRPCRVLSACSLMATRRSPVGPLSYPEQNLASACLPDQA